MRYDFAIGLVRRMGRGDLSLGCGSRQLYICVKKGELKRRLSGLFDPLSAIV